MNYDINYYNNLLKRYSATAEYINKVRWEFVKETKAKTILDFGSGVGWFKAFCPNGAHIDTYDIMPVFQTGITLDNYDLITLWDSYEHTLSADKFVRMGKWVALTLPVLNGKNINNWKHNKPGEHVKIFSEPDEVIEHFRCRFMMEIVKIGTPECPPREDITSFLFKGGA